VVDLVWLLVAGACWLTAGYRLAVAIRREPTADQLTLVVGLALLATAFTLQLPAIRAPIDRIAARPELGQHLAQLLVLGAAFCGQAFLVFISNRLRKAWPMVRRRALAFGMAAVFMVVLFHGAPTDVPILRPEALSARGPGAAYLALYAGYIGFSAADITRLVWRYARWTDGDFLRLGLQLISAGGIVSLAYATAKVVFAMLRTYKIPSLLPVEIAVVSPLMVAAGTLFTVGLILPSWGSRVPGLPRLVGRLASLRNYRLLRPLWTAVVQSAPEIALTGSPPGLRARLYRRVIEINDGLLLLRPYRDPAIRERVTARAGGVLDDVALEAVAEAATIAVALRAKRRGEHKGGPGPASHGSTIPREGDLDREVHRLRLIAQAFVHSPVVAAVVKEDESDRMTRLVPQRAPAAVEQGRAVDPRGTEPAGEDQGAAPT
jgi:hypothetical protein